MKRDRIAVYSPENPCPKCDDPHTRDAGRAAGCFARRACDKCDIVWRVLPIGFKVRLSLKDGRTKWTLQNAE